MPSWIWTARDRVTGKILTNWSPKTGFATKAEFKSHVEHHYQQLQFIDASPSEVPPRGILTPVKPVYFTFGIIDMEREAQRRTRRPGPGFIDLGRATAPIPLSQRFTPLVRK
jgi:hypothetical protein